MVDEQAKYSVGRPWETTITLTFAVTYILVQVTAIENKPNPCLLNAYQRTGYPHEALENGRIYRDRFRVIAHQDC